MRTQQFLGRVQRTLVLTCGELGIQCGTVFESLLAERQGPTAATAVVSLNGSETAWETAVAAALNRISPPDLAARLSQAGWGLAQLPALNLILLLTVTGDGGQRAAASIRSASNQIYRRLGIEPFVLPIWLVGDGSEAWQRDCLTYPQSLPLGNLVLGLCNQEGLRLPDEESLCAVTAELLWCFTTTPLLSQIEQRQIDVPHGDSPPLFTAGVHVWTWSPEAAMARFTQRWLIDVVQQWLADEVDETSLVTAPGWLQTQQLTAKHLAAYALREQEAALPQLPLAEWQMPWPWAVPALFEKCRFENGIDEEATKTYAKQAQLRLQDPLQRAREALHAHAYQLLNSQPVAGVAQTLAWVNAVSNACEALLPAIFDWENRLNEMAESYSVARGETEAQMQEMLSVFPSTIQEWLRLMWRPWRLPGKLLTYWRLQKIGQDLCHVYTKQAALRRQRIEQKTAYQGVIELMQIVRHLASQVDEIAEMLQSRLRQLAIETEPAEEAAEILFHRTHLTVPEPLYEQLVSDEAAEAVAAATAVGGLGSQIRHLDDSIFDTLPRVGESRLAKLNELTSADLLLALSAPAVGGGINPLQVGWVATSPLWPVDAASLNETSRLTQKAFAVFCGANAMLFSDKLGEEAETVFTLTTGWTRHLWLVRLHLGWEASMATVATVQEKTPHE